VAEGVSRTIAKLDPKPESHVFIWFELGKKAYTLYNPDTQSVMFSRDVQFVESFSKPSSPPQGHMSHICVLSQQSLHRTSHQIVEASFHNQPNYISQLDLIEETPRIIATLSHLPLQGSTLGHNQHNPQHPSFLNQHQPA